jgi:hypothetical protein
MKLSTLCPACGQPVTIWRVMSAPTPWHLRCGGCHVRLRAPGLTVPALVAAVVIGVPLGVFAQPMLAAGERREGILLIIAAVAVFELIVSFVLVNRVKLVAKT